MKLLNYENNETYDCYINDDKGYELSLNECGYEKCSPSHYWGGVKKFYLFHYILKGKGILKINDGEERIVRGGQVFFVSPYDKIYYEADEIDPWEYIWIGFSGISAKSILQCSTLLKTGIQDVKNEKLLLSLYKNIAASSRKGDVAYLLVLSGLYRFVAYLLENYGIDRSIRDFNIKEQNFRKIVKMLDEKYKTELLIAAKKAEAANEAKTEFLHRMSHDIRTPINGIYGLINMADHYADDMEKQKEYRTKVKAASNLLLELVNDVLDMSKLESGEVVLEESPFNLSKISEEVLVVIEQIAAEQNIRIVWEKKEIIHRDLIGSPGYVKRVMMNILSNAVKYNRANGHIYISCMEIPSEQPEMTTMEFVCRDTGIGMTEEFQKHIFEPFAQEHAGSRTKFAGTGLGMPITKKLVEKMGGTITADYRENVLEICVSVQKL